MEYESACPRNLQLPFGWERWVQYAFPDDLLEPEKCSKNYYRPLFAGEATNSDYYLKHTVVSSNHSLSRPMV